MDPDKGEQEDNDLFELHSAREQNVTWSWSESTFPKKAQRYFP
jgi:hypothetical protein